MKCPFSSLLYPVFFAVVSVLSEMFSHFANSAFGWIMEHNGIPSEASYGVYEMADGLCHYKQASVGARISGEWMCRALLSSFLLVLLQV